MITEDELVRDKAINRGDAPAKSEGSSPVFWAAIMLLSGTCTTLFAKVQFDISSKGLDSCNVADDDEYNCKFKKPWFSVLEMKAAMALCAIFFYGLGWGRPDAESDPRGYSPTPEALRQVWLPALLDLLNTVLGNIGLVWVSSSIYQMTRGSVVIFSAILSVQWLGKTLRSFHYWSIAFVVIAVVLVGTAGTQQDSDTDDGGDDGGDDKGDDGDSESSTSEIIIGLLFILAAQLVTAIQIITEEKLMTRVGMAPVCLVGMEGLWGMLYFIPLSIILTLTPASDSSISTVWHEDFIDSFVQLGNSPQLAGIAFGYFITILAYNISANFVTQNLSAVVRSILEACRTLGVWAASLALYYIFNSKSVGEAWTAWSWLELGGFAVLLLGTVAYKGLVKLPWVGEEVYEAAREAEEAEAEVNDQYNLLESEA